MAGRLSLVMLATLLIAVTPPTCPAAPAQEPMVARTVALPGPDLAGKSTLESVLTRRRSVRAYLPGALSLGQVGQLLWAAQGITSPDGKRTTPSARAVYPLEVYVVADGIAGLPAGVYCYEPKGHALGLVAPGNHSAALAAAAPRQDFVARAPLAIVVVGDSLLAAQQFGAHAERWMAMEAGFVVQDVYLQATALGLGTVMVGGFEEGALRRALLLPAGRVPLALMPVGRKK